MVGGRTAEAEREREKEREKERRQLCVGCKKKFTKTDYCVSCGMCMYWYHKSCAGLSDEVYKCIENHCKDAPTFWNCTPCTTYIRGITSKMKDLEGKVDAVARHQEEQDSEIMKAHNRIDDTNQAVKQLENRLDSETAGTSVFQELRERNARRLNVVFYGIGESPSESMKERQEWDRQSCANVFRALKLNLGPRSVRYVRRIGEKGNRPRPLLAGMFNINDKELLLDNARNLKDTHFKNVGISADLTPMELKEERDLVAQAEERNKHLSDEDRGKNVKWLVVGPKGSKRLIKGTAREMPASQVPPPPAAATDALGPLQRPRTSSKRGHSTTDSEGEPPSQQTRPKQKKQPRQVAPPREAETAAAADTEEVEVMDQSRAGAAGWVPDY